MERREKSRLRVVWERRAISLAIALICWAILRAIFFGLGTGSFGSNFFALISAFFIYHWIAEESFYRALVKIGSWIGLIKWRLSEARSPRYIEIVHHERPEKKNSFPVEFPDDGLGQEIEEWERERGANLLESLGQGLFASMRADMMKRVYERRAAYLRAKRDYYRAGREWVEEEMRAKSEKLEDLKKISSKEIEIEIKRKELELAKLKKELAKLEEPPKIKTRYEWLEEEFEGMIKEMRLKTEKEWELLETIDELEGELKERYPEHEAEIEDFIHQKKMEAQLKLSREPERDREEDW